MLMYDLLLQLGIHKASAAIVMWLAEGLLFGTALAAMTWCVIWLLRCRRNASLEVFLWSIVLLKFLIPVGPASYLSLASLCARLTGYSQVALVSSEPDFLTFKSQKSTPNEREPAGGHAVTSLWNWMTAFSAVYLTVALVLLAIRIRAYRSLALRCRALPAPDAATCNMVARLCREFNLQTNPSIRVDDQSQASLVIGFLDPIIVISGRQLARPRELETVILHELAHLKRGDMLVRFLQWSASTLLFFWPVVAWVNRRIDEAREHACDVWALRHGTLTAGEYARCLLGAVQPIRMTPLAYYPPCMAGNPSTIERRINLLLRSTDRSDTGRVRSLPSLLFALAWVVFTLTGGVDAKPKSEDWDNRRIAAENAFRAHFGEVMAQVAEYDIGDLDGNGELSYWEKTTFVTTLALSQAEAVVEAYPYADTDQDGELTVTEACDFVRGLPRLRRIERQGEFDREAADEETLNALQEALDAQQWLLDRMTAVPESRDLISNNTFIKEKLARKKE